MKTHGVITALILFALLAAGQGSEAATAPKTTFRVVSSLPGYIVPVGIIEQSPGVLGISVSSPAILSVTVQGKVAYLGGQSFENVISMPVMGPNGRVYSSVTHAGNTPPSNIFSVGLQPGMQQSYAQDGLDTYLAGNLPDGSLWGTASNITTGFPSLIRSDTEGNAATIYQFPLGNTLSLAPTHSSDGNYYGVAWTTPGNYVYRVTPSGEMTTLYNLPPNSVAYTYFVPLVQASDGNLYGLTPVGGSQYYGGFYRLTPTGQYTLLYSFSKGASAYPQALIQASDGNFYGASLGWNQSALFRLSPSGEYTLLRVMSANEAQCQCNIIQGSDGVIYGVALNGGAYGGGSVFALDPGLPKPAPQALQFGPQNGPVGTRVRIWGYNLLNPSVWFGGVPAAAVNNSGPNYVWATVPAGATSGPITVTTPGGTATTTGSFTVK